MEDNHTPTSGGGDLHGAIEAVVNDLGITRKYSGYAFLIYASELVLQDPSLLRKITKKLYPMVAEHFDCKAYNVERAIRTVAQVSWERHRAKLQEIATYDLYKRPTCTDLIDLICCHVRTPVKDEE